MSLLKTKFYPVDPSRQVIHLDPVARERDVAHKWGRGSHCCIGLRGAHLLSYPCYARYRLLPTVTIAQLEKEWADEVARSLYLWQGAATDILRSIRTQSPAEALAYLKQALSRCHHMAVSSYYERAIRGLQECIRQQGLADARDAALAQAANISNR